MGRLTGSPWTPEEPPRRLVDLLLLEPGTRIGFVDDPDGGGAAGR